MLHSLDYLFAVGTIFAFLDAWNIGANDVANSWATSVSSRSLNYLTAMCLASIMEFAGSMGVGARVADTIRTKVVDLDAFKENQSLLMLGMVCAVIASASWLTMATRLGFPVSTTHSIMGGVIGMGIALVGSDNIKWVPDSGVDGGVVSVFLAWVIAPGMAGVFGAILFTMTKYGVMLRKDPVKMAFFAIPFYFWITATLLAMLLIWKGGNYDVDLTDAQIGGVTVATGAGFAMLASFFFLPWLWRIVIKEDWQLRWYHMFQGPFLLRRGEVPPPPTDFHGAVRNYYEGALTREELAERRGAHRDEETHVGETAAESKVIDAVANSDTHSSQDATTHGEQQAQPKSLVGPKPDGPLFSGAVLFWWVKWFFFRGVDQDVHKLQNRQDMLSGDLEETHARSAHYNNKAEFMYTFLQIVTACTASFTHGANDVANAIGPYATIYEIWSEGRIQGDGNKSEVPDWILAFGGVGIVIGIWTYGYHIMANLGNKLTLQTPSRGFSMELGSAITVIIATRFKLPVSTTQCITGAIVGVGLCNGDWRALNWRMIGWIYLGWIITLPCAGIISGCLTGFIVNAPRWGYAVTS